MYRIVVENFCNSINKVLLWGARGSHLHLELGSVCVCGGGGGRGGRRVQNSSSAIGPARVPVPASPHTAPCPRTAAPDRSELFSHSVHS